MAWKGITVMDQRIRFIDVVNFERHEVSGRFKHRGHQNCQIESG